MEYINFTLQANHLLQVLKYKLRQLGWQGMAGILLIVSSLLFFIIVTMPKTQQLQQLQADLVALKAKPKHAIENGSKHSQFDVAQSFYDVLPEQREANNKIGVILDVATDTGLVIDKVEYEQPLSSSPLMQYQIKLPLTGSYMQIRRFINQVLNAMPSIALSDLSLKREDISSEVIDARIQFTLYLQKLK